MKKFSIRNKLIVCFLIPIAFMVVIGIAAYTSAEKGLSSKYEQSTRETISMAAEYVDMACSFVKSEATKYAYDENVDAIVLGVYKKDPASRNKARSGIERAVLASEATNSFIENVHIITKDSNKMISTKSNSVDGIFDQYYEGLEKDARGAIPEWTDSHAMIDEALKLSASDKYILSYQTLCNNRITAVAVDVSAKAMQEFIDTIDVGKGSVVALITPGGKEIFHEPLKLDETGIYNEESVVFADKDFYLAALDKIAEGEVSGSQTVRVNGIEQMFIYAYCDVSGSVICAMVPLETIVAQAIEIKNMTVAVVIVAIIFVLILAIVLTTGIEKNMKRISKKLGEVAKGDLTVAVKAKGKDEFQLLAGSANDMISNTKKLVGKVNQATDTLEMSAIGVKEASSTLSDCSVEIGEAINDINAGIERQSRHAKSCVETTDKLSDEIKNVTEMIVKVNELVSETSNKIAEGVELVQTLGSRTSETTKVTGQVGESIMSLKSESEKINSFVGVITNISAQTNLLSLNASIEAARAGDFGRGFAVVAEEIRVLADQSSTAAGEINKLVEVINEQTNATVKDAKRAQEIVELQAAMVSKSVEVFRSMKEMLDELSASIEEIRSATDAADSRRLEAVDAVRSISEIIGETATNAQKVISVSNELGDYVNNLNSTAESLGYNMDDLKTEIAVFKV
ncbi:MAG: methyl-accepting chemotaxis protein [Lachnospiraceae bacterium]|nr:methyl-accepting chemotaxis protein [Lachnospiraceae bacterium]